MKSIGFFAVILLFPFFAHAEDIQAEAEVLREIPKGIGIDLQYVPAHFPNYVWAGDRTTNNMGNGFHLGVEWIPFDEKYGKLGFGLGVGVSAIRNVQFGEDRATLTAVPVELSMSYRLDYFVRQVLVPLLKVSGGPTYVKTKGIETDWATFRGISYGGGFELCLNRIDSFSASYLQHSTGIHSTYLVAEYLHTDYLGAKKGPNLVRDEWRLGLRFEM